MVNSCGYYWQLHGCSQASSLELRSPLHACAHVHATRTCEAMAAKHTIKMTCPVTLSQKMLGKPAFPSGFTEQMTLRGPTVTCRAMSGQPCRLWSCTGVFRQSQVGRCAPTWALGAHPAPQPPLLHARSRVLGGNTRLETPAGDASWGALLCPSD